MNLGLALFFVVTFGAVAGCLAAVRLLTTAREAATVPTPEAEYGGPDSEDFELDAELLRDDSLSTISIWARLLQRFDGMDIMKRRLHEAGMEWSVGRLTMFMLVAGASTLGTLRMLPVVQTWLSFVLAAGAAWAPYLIVLRRRERRLKRLEEQLPDALDTIARALRAGNPMPVALDLVARECALPLGFELRQLADSRSLGLPLDEALDQLVERVPISEVSEFAAALGMHARTGGKLHEVLAQLSENLRDSQQLKQEIGAIAAHGRMTGMILTLMPVAIGLILSFTNPTQMAMLWVNPFGRDLVGIAVICLVAAHFVIRKMVDIRL